MAENYKEFDKSPIVDTSDVVLKGFRFRVRELAMGVALLVCLMVIIILAALLGSAKGGSSDDGPRHSALTGGQQCFTPPCLKTAAHVTELLNTTAEPCDDFHAFACGRFGQLHPLVPYESEETTFQLIHDRNQERMRRLLERALPPRNNLPFHWERKLRTFFSTCQDHFTKMQDQGRPFLETMVNGSGGWWALQGDGAWAPDRYDFQRQLTKVHVDFWTDAFFTFGLITDWLDWNKNTIQIDLSGMGLPYHYYYNPNLAKFLPHYKNYTRRVGQLLLRDAGLGSLDPSELDYRLETFVEDVFFVESELAMLKRDSNSTENPHAAGSRMKLSELNAASQGAVDWVALFGYMFNRAGVGQNTEVVVLEKEYVIKFSKWINDLPAANKSRILNNYLIWRMADHYDQDLSWDYIHANRQIYVDLTGRAQFLGSWRYCVYRVDRDMKEAMGALFVTNHFSEQNKRTAEEITRYVRKALINSLTDSDWMSSATKLTALEKIKASIMQLGYPDYLTNDSELNMIYAHLDIGQDYFKNLISFNAFYRADWNRRLSKPNDRTHWPYAAYDFVAHYYSPWKRLYIPAGLLQFPIYDHTSPRYTNFGSMGTIVGRQLTHAVDEYGNYYHLNGSGRGSWWSNTTTQRYKDKRQCIIDAFKNITMGPYQTSRGPLRIPVNANYYAPLALGESSSVKLAYKAYHEWMGTTGGEKPMPGGRWTNDQMFFISYAQTYCRTPDSTRELIRVSGGGSVPERIRVNAALSHVPEFSEAFKCQPTSKMVAPKRCSFF
ncbi:endothelin-converting enzyme 1-like [Babylonia areolata]|uniref:endothelin-converting enzyme 1-like n=1 Tax=Babylonia areolata TaxID=304850 RepID=UPI003FCF1055